MRAMILAAGLGTRLRPLSALRAKPAMPVRGLPLVAYDLALLARHGVTEVILNLHHRPESIESAVERWTPAGLRVRYSREPALLGTGGGLRSAARFLSESDPCLVLAGDMLLDADLGELIGTHRRRGDAVTFLLCADPRADRFGTLGLDREGCVVRIARRFQAGVETQAGVYAHATLISRRALETLPDRQAFGHLDDWIAPRLAGGARDVRGVVATPDACRWEPVGTLPEYLGVNLLPTPLSYLDAEALALDAGARLEPELVVGPGARIGAGARLRRVVVWDGEHVPAGLRASEGVFAGGSFHACTRTAEALP